MPNANSILRWGIAGAGKIANDFTVALSASKSHKVVAIASRDKTRAECFAQLHNIPTFYAGYGNLAQNKNIDVVYIGVVISQHVDVAKLMLAGDKHVLCEKPLTVNEMEATELIKYAKFKNLFLMEGIWSRCFPLYQQLLQLIKSGIIGEVMHINISCGFNMTHMERLTSKSLGGGSILDFGVNALQLLQLIFKNLKPIKINAAAHMNKCETDECTLATFMYPNGKSASIIVSSKVELPNEAAIVGTLGTIKMPLFWCPTMLITPFSVYESKLPDMPKKMNYKNTMGLLYEADEVRKCIIDNKKESSLMTHGESLQLANWMDLLRNQIGVLYYQDKVKI